MKTCFACAAFLPLPSERATEFGICLNDESFEPFIDDLLNGFIPVAGRALADQRKISGDSPVCPDFQESEEIEIENESPLGDKLRRLNESGQLTPESLQMAILEERLRRIDWKTLPVEEYSKNLESNRPGKQLEGISSLGALIALGNPAAFETLLRLLSSLPPAATLDEVHLKKEILRHLESWRDQGAVAPVLILELGRTPSNNTTRQWISTIFRFLDRCPLEVIQGPLEEMLLEKRFSQKFRKRVKELLLSGDL